MTDRVEDERRPADGWARGSACPLAIAAVAAAIIVAGLWFGQARGRWSARDPAASRRRRRPRRRRRLRSPAPSGPSGSTCSTRLPATAARTARPPPLALDGDLRPPGARRTTSTAGSTSPASGSSSTSASARDVVGLPALDAAPGLRLPASRSATTPRPWSPGSAERHHGRAETRGTLERIGPVRAGVDHDGRARGGRQPCRDRRVPRAWSSTMREPTATATRTSSGGTCRATGPRSPSWSSGTSGASTTSRSG